MNIGEAILALFAIITVGILGFAIYYKITEGNRMPAQRERILDILPEGCEIYALGSYGSTANIVAVACKHQDTVSTTGEYTSGKTTKTVTSITLE